MKSGTVFELLTEIKIDIDLMSEALGIAQTRLVDLFRSNGRMSSYLFAPRIGTYLNYREVQEDNAPACLVDRNGYRYLIRTVTKSSGVNFCPQFMRGKGRHFEHNKFVDHIKAYRGYILLDVYMFPSLCVYKIGRDEILSLYENGDLISGGMTYAAFNARKKTLKSEKYNGVR